MLEILGFVIAALVGLTLIVAVLILFDLRRQAGLHVTHEQVARAMRDECDLVRRDSSDQARAARGELVHTFGALSQSVDSRVREFGGRLGEGMAAMNGRVDAMSAKLDRDIAQMGDDASRSREVLRDAIEGRLRDHGNAQGVHAKTLRDEVDANVRTLGERNAAALVDIGLQQQERLGNTERALKDLALRGEQRADVLRDTLEKSLHRLSEQNATKLDEMRSVVDEKLQSTLERRLSESFKTVQDQLVRVHESVGQMQSLTSSVGELKSILASPKLRGSFGEIQLEALLTQMLAPQQFTKNAQVRPNTQERVEFVVRFPIKGRDDHLLLPIDAKFPRETYERLTHAMEAGRTDLFPGLRKQLESEIRGFAKDISRKYIAPPVTTEWAMLFLPTEGLHLEVLNMPGLLERLQRDHKIIVVGPTTLAAQLNSLQMYACALDVERKSGEVYNLLGAVKKQFGLYNGVVGQLAKQLNTATGSVQKLGRQTVSMQRALERVHEVPDARTAAELLGLDQTFDDPAEDGLNTPFLLVSDDAA